MLLEVGGFENLEGKESWNTIGYLSWFILQDLVGLSLFKGMEKRNTEEKQEKREKNKKKNKYNKKREKQWEQKKKNE